MQIPSQFRSHWACHRRRQLCLHCWHWNSYRMIAPWAMNMVSSKCHGILSYNRAVASDMSGLCRLFAGLNGHRVNISHRRNVVLEHNKQSECMQAHLQHMGIPTYQDNAMSGAMSDNATLFIQYFHVHFISEVHTCVSSHIEGCSSPVHSISWPVPSTHDLMCHIILQTRLIVLTRDGSSTLALVLKSPLSTFSEVLDGAFKHLVSWSTCGWLSSNPIT